MSDEDTAERKPGKLRLAPKGKLELKKTVGAGNVRQSFPRGRSKTVTVEVKKTRAVGSGGAGSAAGGLSEAEKAARLKALQASQSGASALAPPPAPPPRPRPAPKPVAETPPPVEEASVEVVVATPEVEAETAAPALPAPVDDAPITTGTLVAKPVVIEPEPEPEPEPVVAGAEPEPEPVKPPEPELTAEERELLELKRANEEENEKQAAARRLAEARAEAAAPRRRPEDTRRAAPGRGDDARRGPPARGDDARRGPPRPGNDRPGQSRPPPRRPGGDEATTTPDQPTGRDERRRPSRPQVEERKAAAPKRGERTDDRRRTGKLTISQALDDNVAEERTRSLASLRRAREREKQQRQERGGQDTSFVVREVRVPEIIEVSELANRMAVRGGDVVRKLMQLGVMATVNQAIDADTAELVVEEFGHRIRRVLESDVEIGLDGPDETDTDLSPRSPVVTIMGHVDHGKTSLLDAFRKTKVVDGEAGGITQHIGAYQVEASNGSRITFLDTPGHAAFSAMRQRGAGVTDIVILVVAADDGVQPQTIEAINHARAAKAPIIVAINKIDKVDANPDIAKQGLLSHELVAEDFGGDVQMVPVSAITGEGLDTLLEAVSLQAELLELKANPNREARGAVVEAKLDRGRGAVATVLVQTGTLKRGDVLVAGAEWGRVRALINENGEQVKEAGPSMPVEVLGLSGVPMAGDDVVVVENDARAREVSEYRQRIYRDKRTATTPRGTIEDMFGRVAAGESKELPVVVKTDVQGSLEAILAALDKFRNDEVSIRVLHGGVGAISESDVTLASSSGGFLLGFNVRAAGAARSQAQQDGVDIRYYSIIYELLDDMKAAVEGLLAPEQRERFIGNAEIREVFNITKVGRIAGCRITDGVVRRGAGVRLLRDNVVIHEGKLGTLKRFKEEVREVRDGFECGMGFENYHDIQVGDVIECFEVEEIARAL
jgi:translation initiation factor IF-2